MRYLFVGMLICLSALAAAEPQSQRHERQMKVNGQTLQTTIWQCPQTQAQRDVLLLSGPVDSWQSDSGWWANLAPRFDCRYRVIAVDRAGVYLANPQAKLGYVQFARDLSELIENLQSDSFTIVAFASSNISVQLMLQDDGLADRVKGIVMIDPDVLTPFSINRYKKDAAPFKQEFEPYQAYIKSGQYTDRVKQRNATETEHLQQLVEEDAKTDWQWLANVMQARLEIVNQQNLFAEIAQYGDDLDAAYRVTLPEKLALTIFDTDFEQGYIDAVDDPEVAKELAAWRADGKKYYQGLVANSRDGNYVELATKQHLLGFTEPQRILEAVGQFYTSP